MFKGGLTVYTTLDTRLQGYAESAVKNKLPHKSDPQAALVSIDPRTGYVKALVGGRDYRKSKFNLATQGYRQPGSSFKTFVLVTALEKGMPPSMRIDSSSPAAIPSKPKPWIVDNSEGAGRGMMTLQSATVASVNTVFARVAWELGIKNVVATAKRMGITTKHPQVPVHRARCRQRDAATRWRPRTARSRLRAFAASRSCITKVVDRDDKTIFVAKRHGSRVIKAPVAKAAIDVMRGVIIGRHRSARQHRSTGCRKDRDQPAQPRRVVRRVHAAARHGGVGRLSEGAHDLRERLPGLRRHGERSDLGVLHAPRAGGSTGSRLSEPAPTCVQPVEVPHSGQQACRASRV